MTLRQYPGRAAAWMVAAAAVTGLLLRLWFGLGYWVGQPLTHDEREYLLLAQSLAAGEGFRYPPDTSGDPVQRFGRAPLYPLILSWIVGPGFDADVEAVPDAVKVGQSVFGTLAIPVLAAVAWRIAGPGAGALAAGLTAIHPMLVATTGYALTEAVFIPIAWAGVLLFGMATGPPASSPSRDALLSLATGIVTGVAVLIRPGFLVFLALAVSWLALRGPRRLALPLLLGAALVIAPWTIRNVREHGRFILIASEGGITFWTGNHPLARGEGDMAANPRIALANQELRRRYPGHGPEALESVYYREAVEQIASHPLWWAGLTLRKAFYLVVPIGPSYTLHSARYQAASIGSYLLLLPFAVAGALALRRARAPATALALMVSTAIVIALVFFPQERFRIPVIDPALIVCAAAWIAGRLPRR